MKINLKTMAVAAVAAAALTTAALAQSPTFPQQSSITFSGYAWNTTPASTVAGSNNHTDQNSFTGSGNTGYLFGLYNLNTAIVTPVTVGVGYTASYDMYLSDASQNANATWATEYYGAGNAWGGNFLGNWTSQFVDGTTVGGDNNVTYRTASGNGIQGGGDNGHFDLALNDGTGAQGGDGNFFNVSENLSTGVNFLYTFGLNSYTITATALANSSETLTETYNYENGNVNSIQGFVTGLYNSEATSTISDFTITPAPEPGTMALMGLGSLGLLLAARRRGWAGHRS